MIDIKGTPFCYDSTQQKTIDEISQRVMDLRKGGRLTSEVLRTIRNYFRIKNIYHSNAIEGNVLDVGETRQVVEFGLTLTGKPLKDQAEAKNLSHALDYLEDLATDQTTPISESDVRQIHALVLKGNDDDNAGRYRKVSVEVSGSEFKPPAPESLPALMKDFGEWLKDSSVFDNEYGDPEGLLSACVAHTWLVHIHPFIDGNGRVARLLMNLILMRYGYPIGIITREDRLRYYDALEISQSSDLTPFISLLSESLFESLEEYEVAVEQQREKEEWAQSLASQFGAKLEVKVSNEYEVWRSAMDLLKSYFRQTAELIDEAAQFGDIYFKDFGTLELQKYQSLLTGESTKKTWFFRVDFRSGDRTARYLFFFGYPSWSMKSDCGVTLHVAREEPPGSFNYERLEYIDAPNVPALLELGYIPKGEVFVARTSPDKKKEGKIEVIGKKFFDDVIEFHFSN
jgi:Fic family protein